MNNMAPRVLILPTSTMPPQAAPEIAAGMRPRIDYLDLQARLNADVIDFSVYRQTPQRWMVKADRILRLAWGQAFYVMRNWRNYDLIFSLGEDIAIPLAFLMRLRGPQPRHLVVAHNIASPIKAPFVRAMHVMSTFERIIVLSTASIAQIMQIYHIPRERIVFLMDAIDEIYWQPMQNVFAHPVTNDRLVLSIGQAKRDYQTLIQSVEGLACHLQIQTGSQWMTDHPVGNHMYPANVTFGEYLSFAQLRDLYMQAAFVVIALCPGAHHSAGSVSIKEAMAMGKAVVVASDGGLEDYVHHGETGLLVPSANPAALAKAIRLLLENPQMAMHMGRNARSSLEREMSYTTKLDRMVQLTGETNSDRI